ncbi:cell wall hydrolase [Kiloniella majae]|uniref:cell wall hydrolase n=1 Tax=Kiloniella majae TaxID=1938558 RepID=UPI0015C5080E|nr:cell wall hydrolase [Kiloniella majae]
MSKNNVIYLNSTADILARTAWGEARSEGSQGMQAVINVVMNRHKDPRTWWGRSVRDICLFSYKGVHQFSAWNEGDANKPKMLVVDETDANFRTALSLANMALKGDLPDITGGADHYHTKAIDPYWAASGVKVADLGSHLFYKVS